MLTRRGFVGCALCALGGFSATDAGAQSGGLKRTLISRTDGPAAGYETLEMRVEIPAGSTVARHIHHGIETSFVTEGSLMLEVEGAGSKTYTAGQGFQVPVKTPHGGKVGDKPTALVAVYVVEKGKPLAQPV